MLFKCKHVVGLRALALVLLVLMCFWKSAAAQSLESPPLAWDQIEKLDLETAARLALATNPTIAAARARVEQARQKVVQAKSVYWPSLDLEASAARVDMSENAYQSQLLSLQAVNPFATVTDPEDYYKLGLKASWVLFNGFARKFNVAMATYGEQVSAAARDEARRLLLSALATAFLSAQLAQENMAIADADVAFNERLLTEARLRYEVGTGALSDVLNFQIKANSGLTQRNQSERDFQISLVTLAALIGLPQAVLPDHVQLADLKPATDSDLNAPKVPELLEKAHLFRPDLRQSARSVDMAEARIGAAKATYYPTLALSASVDGERTEDPNFEGDDFGNTIALGLSYPIFSGGLYKARRQEAKAQLLEAQKLEEETELNITSEIRTTTARVLNAQRQLLLQQTSVDLVQKNRDLVEKEYKAGVGSLVRLNEAQRDLTAAQVRLVSARVALYLAWFDVYAATGEILNYFEP
jgi:TolC family type I secretion outer membrane protein